MRVTVTLDKETATLLDQYARASGVSRARAAALIVSQRLRPMRIKYRDGFPILDLPKGGQPITTEFVKSLEDEWWDSLTTGHRTIRNVR